MPWSLREFLGTLKGDLLSRSSQGSGKGLPMDSWIIRDGGFSKEPLFKRDPLSAAACKLYR